MFVQYVIIELVVQLQQFSLHFHIFWLQTHESRSCWISHRFVSFSSQPLIKLQLLFAPSLYLFWNHDLGFISDSYLENFTKSNSAIKIQNISSKPSINTNHTLKKFLLRIYYVPTKFKNFFEFEISFRFLIQFPIEYPIFI